MRPLTCGSRSNRRRTGIHTERGDIHSTLNSTGVSQEMKSSNQLAKRLWCVPRRSRMQVDICGSEALCQLLSCIMSKMAHTTSTFTKKTASWKREIKPTTQMVLQPKRELATRALRLEPSVIRGPNMRFYGCLTEHVSGRSTDRPGRAGGNEATHVVLQLRIAL